MVSYALVQSKTAYGYAQVAQTIGGGTAYQQYRPTGAGNPLSGSPLATLPAVFSQSEDMSFKRAANYNKPSWFGAFDLTNVQVGDYLVGQQGTFFVATIAPVSPFGAPRCILCNAVLTVKRQPEDTTTVGQLGYGGDIEVNEQVLLTSWPASVLETRRATAGNTRLPGDENMGWFEVLMPALAGTLFTQNDILVDASGRRYRMSSVEQSTLGWRLHVVVTMT